MADQDPFGAYAVKASDDPFAAFATTPTGPKNPPLLATLNRNPNVEVPDRSQSVIGRLQMATEGMRYPTSVGDILPYLIPGGVESAVSAAKNVGRQMTGALEGSSLLKAPGRIIGRVVERWKDPLTAGEREFRDAPIYKQMESMGPETTPAGPIRGTLRAQMPPVEPMASHPAPITQGAVAEPSVSGLSATERAALAKQGYSPEVIAKIETQIQPTASHTPQAVSPLRQPRIDIGAEKVGRLQKLTKEQVRQQTGPILNEAPGTASPILPEKALQRIVDDMKALPKEGGAREAYVQAATSGKAQAQIENIRRTLEHLGLLVPVAAGVAMGSRNEQ